MSSKIFKQHRSYIYSPVQPRLSFGISCCLFYQTSNQRGSRRFELRTKWSTIMLHTIADICSIVKLDFNHIIVLCSIISHKVHYQVYSCPPKIMTCKHVYTKILGFPRVLQFPFNIFVTKVHIFLRISTNNSFKNQDFCRHFWQQ